VRNLKFSILLPFIQIVLTVLAAIISRGSGEGDNQMIRYSFK
jgi:hypothetical protein